MNVNEINMAALAYLGDAVYELEIRKYLLNKKISKSNDLQKSAINYVSAKAQAEILENLQDKNIFNEAELLLIKKARNYKTASKPRYVDIKTYKKATALEALFGALYISNNFSRIKILMKEILGD